MESKIRIAAIGGSPEDGSSTLAIMKHAAQELRLLGADVKVIDIKELNLPLYNYSNGLNKADGDLKKLLDEIHSADGFILASPEYHGTVSAAFKNAIDYLEFLAEYKPPYLTFKPVGCIAAAGSENAGSVTLQTMISIVHSLRGIAASSSIAVGSAARQVDENGVVQNEALKRKLKRLAEEVYTLAVKLK